MLDRESPTYALDVVSVVESILDDPRQVLYAQRNKARGEAVAAMKAEGIEYDERMELLQDVTHPRPLADLLGAAYEIYRQGHPWVADHELRPKSVVRDMFERAMNFVEYVGFYQLARSEGLVLRYLADAYRTLRQTLPDAVRTEELDDIIEWLGELVRQVDSSLLDEWEQLRAGGSGSDAGPVQVPTGPPRVTANARAFRVLVRNALFRRVELAARRDWDALGELDSAAGWDADAWRDALEPYFAEHHEIGTGPDARGPGAADRRRAARAVAGASDPRRPGRRPRLGLLRRGRPARLRRGRRGRPHRDPRQPPLTRRTPSLLPACHWSEGRFPAPGSNPPTSDTQVPGADGVGDAQGLRHTEM